MQPNKKIVINAKKCLEEANIEIIANKLNKLLDENNITTKVLSEATGVSIALVNNLKRGEGNPTIGTLNVICNFFNISLLELLGLDNVNNIQKSIKSISIYDLRVSHERAEENILSKMVIETPKNTNIDSLFGISINNNILFPLYEKGTIFVLTSAPAATDGDIALVRIQKHTNSLKRLFIKKDNFYLKNINMDDSLELYSKNDVEIVGVVIQIIQKTM